MRTTTDHKSRILRIWKFDEWKWCKRHIQLHPLLSHDCMNYEARQTASHVFSQVENPVKDIIVAKYAVAFVPSCTWAYGWTCEFVYEGYSIFFLAGIRYVRLTYIVHRPTHTHSHDAFFAHEQRHSPLFMHAPETIPFRFFPTSPSRMKIHYCVIVKFPVCRRRHMSECETDNTTCDFQVAH